MSEIESKVSHKNLKNTFPVRKDKFDQIFVGIKFIYRLKPFQTLTCEDESCNG